MPERPNPLPSEDVILARFYRLNATIGLSATKFGYVSLGQPGLIKRLKSGHKLRDASKARVVECLDEIERGHSEPIKHNISDMED